ncbi:HutD family protein [Tissierella sp. Yu-01]|uniref:HutD family protein n=1 Tax=Tissierella sp. Yu-01 TaxID=3035694 RepID=UPI00240CF14B|nr:HutD family protein [Tissierella sp. Yu-01]WFA08903.1 HutD family protein [Tissierella sp. Yu-01]
MKERTIKREDFITTKWAGGETTQLAIYPEDANFSDKDFLFRVSSATFTSTESKFSDFSGYQRYILPLDGKLSVSHEGLYDRELDKYEVEYFDGSWSTFSKNTLDCRDYNFIVKSGSLAKMQILKEGDEYLLKGSEIVTILSMNNFVLNLDNHKEKRDIGGFSLFVLEIDGEEKISIISSKSPVIITEFKISPVK